MSSDEFIENGDFEGGRSKWKGDGRVVDDGTGNHVIELEARKGKVREITHEIELDDSREIIVHFRARVSEGSRPVDLRKAWRNPRGGAGFSGEKLDPDGQWKQCRTTYRKKDDKEERILAFVLLEGEEGTVQFDDFKIEIVE